jgi:isocitrate dehydrogenase kinase/phosphatase
MSTFPKFLPAQFSYVMAQVILDGINCYDRIFLEASLEAIDASKSHHWLEIKEVFATHMFPNNYNIFLMGAKRVRNYFLYIRPIY